MVDKNYHKEYRKDYDKKTKYVTVSIPISEYEELEKQAKKEGVKVSTLLKNMALAYMQTKTLTPKAIEDRLSEFIFLMRNIANNINQIARNSNLLKHLVEENGLLMELKKIEDLVKEYTLNKIKN
jgi:hypothetical protein